MQISGSVLELRLAREELRVSLLDKKGEILLTASDPWQPRELDGVETYTLLQIWPGIRTLYKELAAQYRTEYGSALEEVSAIAVRGMGKGWMPFDPRMTLLTTYRGAWDPRPEAAAALSEALDTRIEEDSAVSYLWQAMLDGEPYLPYVDYITTLPGYVYWRLTGFRSLARDSAAGIFPLDESGQYDTALLAKFDALAAGRLPKPLIDLLPEVLAPGESGGTLMRESLRMIDPSGDLWDGIPLLPPEDL